MSSLTIQKVNTVARPVNRATVDASAISLLTNEHKEEALAFLSARPLHTVCMTGLIKDNNLVSPLNRGSFYGHRDAQGCLDGVALIGHVTIIEARTEEAVRAFAELVHQTPTVHVIVGEQNRIERFWNYFEPFGRTPRLINHDLLMEQRWPVESVKPVDNLRQATHDDLQQVMRITAEMIYEERGVNPLERDPQGFRERCARRIARQRVWVLMKQDRLIFKAEVIANTTEVTYLEGVYVDPQERRKGYGLRCLSQLSRHLLSSTRSISLLVNDHNQAAQALYDKAGFKLRSRYNAVFLQ